MNAPSRIVNKQRIDDDDDRIRRSKETSAKYSRRKTKEMSEMTETERITYRAMRALKKKLHLEKKDKALRNEYLDLQGGTEDMVRKAANIRW